MGYPGDHLGISLSIISLGRTDIGAGAWRLPLHLLDDAAFCETTQVRVPAFLAAHPITAAYSRCQRWEVLKREIRATPSADPVSWRASGARTPATWRLIAEQHRQHLQQPQQNPPPLPLGSRRSCSCCGSTSPPPGGSPPGWPGLGAVWGAVHRPVPPHCQGEAGPDPNPLHSSLGQTLMTLDSPARRREALPSLARLFSGAAPQGLFNARSVCVAAQDTLLAAVDQRLTPAAATAGERGARGRKPHSCGAGGCPACAASRQSAGPGRLPIRVLPALRGGRGRRAHCGSPGRISSADSPALPAGMLQGRITLLHKGKGANRSLSSSYRPITLLNTDFKLAARAVASRMGPLHTGVVIATQTGFLPNMWIGDNGLAHLEETQQLGVMLFLDFEKAFDRLDRGGPG